MLARLIFGAAMAGAGLAAGHLLAQKKLKKTIFDVRLGDLIQWESNGAFVFPQPKEVISIEEHELGTYVFVEDGRTGIPAEQVVVMRRVEDNNDT